MFQSVRMKYLRAIVLLRDERLILHSLGKMGLVHLSRVRDDEAAPISPPELTEELSLCDGIVTKADELLKSFAGIDSTIVEHEQRVEVCNLPMAQIEELLQSAALRVDEFNQRISASATRCDSIRTVLEQLNSFREVQLPFSELDRFSFLHFAVGSIPKEKADELRTAVGPNVVLLEFPRNDVRTAMIAVTSRTGRFALHSELEKVGFQAECVSVENDEPIELAIVKAEDELKEAEKSQEEAILARRGLIFSLSPVVYGYRLAAIGEKRILQAETQLSRTDLTVQIQGWVATSDAEKVSKKIREITDGKSAIELLNPEEVPDVQVPILLRHNWFLRPFEMLIAGYGVPGYQELEPTLFVAITYMLMFGMMFGDLGHGFILVLAGLVTIFRTKKQQSRDVGTLVAFAGVASMIFGVIYGSFFGIHGFHKYALWHDPLEGNPMDIMVLALSCGVLVISVGIVLNIINRIRKKDWGGAFFSGFGVVGALFYWGVLGLLLKSAVISEMGMKWVVVALVIALPLISWALYEPIHLAIQKKKALKKGLEANDESIGDSFAESCIGAFENVLSYMANTISFIRLAAYAMSHAAVLMATFLLADSIGKSDPTGLGSIIIIIIGNCIAIVLEGLIAAIQALRLEYYEFFGKFFSGEGKAFEPFQVE